MPSIICEIVLVIIFSLLATLHFYWGVGGRWAIENVVPTNERGKKILQTSPTSCFVVGSGLLIFSGYYLLLAINITLPISYIWSAAGWIIPTVFLLRAIGDFKYVGFTKRITNTTFAKLDTAYFARLCLFIAMCGYVVAILS